MFCGMCLYYFLCESTNRFLAHDRLVEPLTVCLRSKLNNEWGGRVEYFGPNRGIASIMMHSVSETDDASRRK